MLPAPGVLGEAIRVAREEVGISQAELARRIGISKNAMNDIETGHTDPRASRIVAIALALDVRTDFLLGLEIGYKRLKREKKIIGDLKETAHSTPAPLKRQRTRQAKQNAPDPAPQSTKRQRTRKAAPVA
jgi:transcriptional regulator with XRE-family HTH domain